MCPHLEGCGIVGEAGRTAGHCRILRRRERHIAKLRRRLVTVLQLVERGQHRRVGGGSVAQAAAASGVLHDGGRAHKGGRGLVELGLAQVDKAADALILVEVGGVQGELFYGRDDIGHPAARSLPVSFRFLFLGLLAMLSYLFTLLAGLLGSLLALLLTPFGFLFAAFSLLFVLFCLIFATFCILFTAF